MDRHVRHLLDGGFKLRHLQFIVAVAENRTIVGAAQDLHVTQPVVTRALREAEGILGVELFARGPRGVSPTPFGELVIDHAHAVLANLHRVEEGIHHLRESGNRPLRIGTNMSASYALVPRAVVAVRDQMPTVRITVVAGTDETLLDDLVHSRLDVVVGRLFVDVDLDVDNRHAVQRIHLYDEPIRIMARRDHPAVLTGASRLDELVDYPWIYPIASTNLIDQVRRDFLRAGRGLPHNVMECSSHLTTRAVLRATDALALVPMHVGVEDDDFTLLPTVLDTVSREIGVTHLRAVRPTGPLELLIDRLRDVADETESG
ncbi:MAG: LysR substrate-binding domain-containing protein [Gordonia paraffinivorans]